MKKLVSILGLLISIEVFAQNCDDELRRVCTRESTAYYERIESRKKIEKGKIYPEDIPTLEAILTWPERCRCMGTDSFVGYGSPVKNLFVKIPENKDKITALLESAKGEKKEKDNRDQKIAEAKKTCPIYDRCDEDILYGGNKGCKFSSGDDACGPGAHFESPEKELKKLQNLERKNDLGTYSSHRKFYENLLKCKCWIDTNPKFEILSQTYTKFFNDYDKRRKASRDKAIAVKKAQDEADAKASAERRAQEEIKTKELEMKRASKECKAASLRSEYCGVQVTIRVLERQIEHQKRIESETGILNKKIVYDSANAKIHYEDRANNIEQKISSSGADRPDCKIEDSGTLGVISNASSDLKKRYNAACGSED